MNEISEVIKEKKEGVYSYNEYRQLVEKLLRENKTTGPNQSESYIGYTKMNHQRMNRWDKKIILTDDLKTKIKSIDQKQTWLVLTEAWCGDAAHNIPVMAKIADLNPNIDLKLILRDDNLDIMDQYLTNGGRSIPKLVVFNEVNEELFNWGPRPNDLQQLVVKIKKDEVDAEESKIAIQKWYNKDKSLSVQKEFASLLE